MRTYRDIPNWPSAFSLLTAPVRDILTRTRAVRRENAEGQLGMSRYVRIQIPHRISGTERFVEEPAMTGGLPGLKRCINHRSWRPRSNVPLRTLSVVRLCVSPPESNFGVLGRGCPSSDPFSRFHPLAGATSPTQYHLIFGASGRRPLDNQSTFIFTSDHGDSQPTTHPSNAHLVALIGRILTGSRSFKTPWNRWVGCP